MYNTSIFMFLSWPLLIILCWIAVRVAMIFFENREKEPEQDLGKMGD